MDHGKQSSGLGKFPKDDMKEKNGVNESSQDRLKPSSKVEEEIKKVEIRYGRKQVLLHSSQENEGKS